MIQGLTIGFRVVKYAKYFENSKFGCILIFNCDINLADQYYLDHFTNTNRPMFLCTPDVAVDVEKRKIYLKHHSKIHCWRYQLGLMEILYTRHTWGHSWKYLKGELIATLSIIGTIAIAGVIGQFIQYTSFHHLPKFFVIQVQV